MLMIDELRMTLPPLLRERASNIGRLVCVELSRLRIDASSRNASLAVPMVHVPSEASDEMVAREVARAIHCALDSLPSRKG